MFEISLEAKSGGQSVTLLINVTNQYPHQTNFEALKGESDMVAMVEVVDSMVSGPRESCPQVFYYSKLVTISHFLCIETEILNRSRLFYLLSQVNQMDFSW